MRRNIVAGNWKMNFGPQKTTELIEALKPLVASYTHTDIVCCVPFVDIAAAVKASEGSNIAIGAQNMYIEESGAYTGEIAPSMLVEAGCRYVVLGHSERREYFQESDEFINKKVLKALEHGLMPILCVGEKLEQRDQGITEDLVRMQVKIAFQGVSEEEADKVVVAYEPIWAIGTGRTATDEQAQEVCGAIRKVLGEIYSPETAQKIRIQYGGSVNAGNAKGLFAMPDIDGGLVGGASLKPDFAVIVEAAE